jgi:Rrf2 family protein
MRISARGDAACRALTSIALHPHDQSVCARVIAERTGLSAPFLAQVLAACRRAGVIRGDRGRTGGYRLAHPPQAISLLDILDAVDGPPLQPVPELDPLTAVLAPIWASVDDGARRLLAQVTIADVAALATAAPAETSRHPPRRTVIRHRRRRHQPLPELEPATGAAIRQTGPCREQGSHRRRRPKRRRSRRRFGYRSSRQRNEHLLICCSMGPPPSPASNNAVAADRLAVACDLLRALGTPHRLAIVLELANGPRCVHELIDTLGISQSLTSQHLRVLRSTGLVVGSRRGKETLYALADDHVAHIARDAVAHGNEEAPRSPEDPNTTEEHHP